MIQHYHGRADHQRTAKAWAGATCLLLLCLAPAYRAANPAFYQRKATWQESMEASVEAIRQLNLEEPFAPWESPTLRGGEPARKVSVELNGARELHLMVTGCPNPKWGVADWADARLLTPDGRAVPLTTASAEGSGGTNVPFRVLKGRFDLNITLHSGLYEPLRIAGQHYPLGIHVQADSEILVPLEPGRYARFEASAGIDDWAKTNGHVRFSVLGRRSAARRQLWDLVARDFPHALPRRQMRWEQEDRIWEAEWQDAAGLAQRYVRAAARVPALGAAAAAATNHPGAGELSAVRALYYRACELADARRELAEFNVESVRLALADLRDSFGTRYPQGTNYLRRLAELVADRTRTLAEFNEQAAAHWEQAARLAASLRDLRDEALLANPLLDFEQLLLVKRRPVGEPRRSQWEDRGLGEYVGMPRQSSWGHGTMTWLDIWDNEISVLSPVRPGGALKTLHRPPGKRLISDIDLHFSAEKMLFSMPDANRRWQVYELAADGRQVRQLTPGEHPDVHNYSGIYLPNGNILFISTAPLQGVPCNAGVIVGMMYLMDPNGGHIRQVGFEQDHDYTPSLMPDGRVLYLRWDYTDTPHVWNRVLMSMNPDGTGQMEVYGSNSYWPNAVFFARSIPGHPTQIAGIVTGHHEGRVGELVVFDPQKGRQETDGVVQRIPGRGQRVEPLIEDKLTEHSWPKYLHPWPLNEKYFLAACKPEPDSLWGLYLVDVFDNRVLVREEEDYALLEPRPFRPTPRPPVIPDKVQPEQNTAVVYLEDVYAGPGLKGVPRGTVKSLRLFTYHFGYQRVAGIDHRVGSNGPWEVKRVLGTVPVEGDGSALFRIPARTPISVQPLDAEGKALALMRSWMTAMPGENLSCVGCHERQNSTPTPRQTLALKVKPREITPWHGPLHGFSFARDVQPMLDRYCVACHDRATPENGQIDLRADQGGFVVYEHGNPQLKRVDGQPREQLVGKYSGVFEPSYAALRHFVRVGGLESDLHLLPPKEFHADTSELVQMLKKGHHGVRLDAGAWDRLVTWIDLNAPCNGTWKETTRIPIAGQPSRRLELRRAYGGIDDDAEAIPAAETRPVEPIRPQPVVRPVASVPSLAGWPLAAATAQARQEAAGPAARALELGGGLRMEFVRIPAGSFIMGDPQGGEDETPCCAVEIRDPFWMARFEVTNEQYRQFDPRHDSRFEHRTSWIFSDAYVGWPLNQPRQPVVRVSWDEALAFCQWLSARAGVRVNLPTEAQWEYACRAGTATPWHYGGPEADFSVFANLGDASLKRLADEGWRPKAPDLVPRDNRFNDGSLVTAEVGSYRPNVWGLHDLHGNAAEWTRSTFQPYPYAWQAEGPAGEKVVRGGSWRDRPKNCRSSSRLSYPAYQKIYNVGFRVIIEDDQRLLRADRSGATGSR